MEIVSGYTANEFFKKLNEVNWYTKQKLIGGI